MAKLKLLQQTESVKNVKSKQKKTRNKNKTKLIQQIVLISLEKK